jgi:hypothetical protein
MNASGNSEVNKSIYEDMNSRETNELLNIWYEQDRGTWTGEALETVRRILVERLGTIPPEPQPAQKGGSMETEQEARDAAKEDHYYNPEVIDRISSAAKALSWAVLVVAAAYVIFNVVYIVRQGSQVPLNSIISVTLTFLIILLVAGFFHLVLQAIGEGLYLLMDIEDNTHRRS